MKYLNLLLILCIILLFLYDLNLSKNLGVIKKYKINNFNILKQMVKKLSKCMNGQILVIEFNNKKIIELIKYQNDNLWEIELIYDLTNRKNEFIALKNWLIKRDIAFEHKEFNKKFEGLIVNCKNNLDKLIKILEFIIYDLEQLSSSAIPLCYFLKISKEY